MSDTTPLAADVTPAAIAALLVGRAPDLLNDPDTKDAVQHLITGITVEVTRIVGDPPPDALRPLAAWAITLGVAASLESSLHPEQQLGDEGRSADLRVKYLAVLADLRGGPTPVAQHNRPVGYFPPPPGCWPDAPWPSRQPWTLGGAG